MSLKHLSQIILAIFVSVSAGVFVRDNIQQGNCNREALDSVLSGGYLILEDDCVLIVSPAVVITGDVIIEGGILHSNGVDRVLIVNVGANLTLRNTAILSGSIEIEPAYGGAIYNAGILLLENTRIVANSAEQGGAIYNTGHLYIVNSEFARNRAREGGAIYNRGIMMIQSSTINENSVRSSADYGGYGAGIVNRGQADIRASQIINNRGDGEGIGIDTSGRLFIQNSIIAGNQCTVSDCSATGILRFDGTVDAINNYWGSPDGPGEEGNGSGDGVVGLDAESYTPFLTEIPGWAE